MNDRKIAYAMLITNIILAVSTVTYACLTWKLVGETAFINTISREQYFNQVRPMIVLDTVKAVNSSTTIYTEVKNLGNSEGYDIHISYNVDADLTYKNEDGVKHTQASYTQDVDHLYPNQLFQNIVSLKVKKAVEAKARLSYVISYKGKVLGTEKQWKEEGRFFWDPVVKVWLNQPK